MDEVPLVMRVPILVMAAVIILLGVFNGPIISIVLDPFIPTGIP